MPIVGERERRIASNTVLAVLAVLAACIPDVQLKDNVSAASVSGGGGGAPSSECVARALEEWRFDSAEQARASEAAAPAATRAVASAPR